MSLIPIKYVVICSSLGEEVFIYHMCGYPTNPSNEALVHMIEELATDETFKMVGMTYGLDYMVSVVDRDYEPLQELMAEYGVPYEFELGGDKNGKSI